MQALQLFARHFSSPGHAFCGSIERPLVGFIPGPGEMPQITSEREPLGAGERLHFTLNLQQGHTGRLAGRFAKARRGLPRGRNFAVCYPSCDCQGQVS